jgi:hypothetical protein
VYRLVGDWTPRAERPGNPSDQEITMNSIKNTFAAVVAAATLSLVAACGDLEEPATGADTSVEKSKGPAAKLPVRDHTNRMDFGDGEATLPAEPKRTRDTNSSRLDFGDDGRP